MSIEKRLKKEVSRNNKRFSADNEQIKNFENYEEEIKKAGLFEKKEYSLPPLNTIGERTSQVFGKVLRNPDFN